MERKEDPLRELQKCFINMERKLCENVITTNSEENAENETYPNRNRCSSSFDEASIYIPCSRSNSFVDSGEAYSTRTPVIKMGWLDKTPPKGTLIFQKRWVTLDAEFLRYFDNEKEVFSKRFIAVSTITNVRLDGEQKFDVMTKNRTFLFRAESNFVRDQWLEVLKETIQQNKRRTRSMSFREWNDGVEKEGYLEMSGVRSKLYLVIRAERAFLYRNSEEYNQGIGITCIDMNLGNVKSLDKCAFSLNTCYKLFSFVAENKQQRDEWVEAMQACIGRSLSSDEVVWRIWAEEANKSCADCGAEDPDWASVNLCVVICKCCAGVHRSLGQHVSKVRSLRMDEKVWTKRLIEVFLLLGNHRANQFWASNVPPSETICPSSNSEERQNFIKTKYCQGKYKRYHELFGCQEELNTALCQSVRTGDLLETLSLVFCGADVNCFTGDPDLPNPLSIAQHCGQTLQEEFLEHNLSTVFPREPDVEWDVPEASVTTLHSGTLFKIASTTRVVTERKAKGDFSQRWCTLDKGVFRYYDSEKSTNPSGEIKMCDTQCLAVNPLEKHGYVHTFELYHISGRIYLFGADIGDSVQDWIEAIAKAMVPPEAEGITSGSFERMGRLCYTEGPNSHSPRECWAAVEGSTLLFLSAGSQKAESIDLRKLQEICVQAEPPLVVLVDRGRTLRFEGDRRADFPGWVNSLQQGSGKGDGPLDKQQLTCMDVPVIVHRCLSFIIQYGLKSDGLYRKAGSQSKVTTLLESLCQDARRVQLVEGEYLVDDVANVLKRFLRTVSHGVFNGEKASLLWLQTLAFDGSQRIFQYQALLRDLPPVHRATLGAIINHLYCVQCFSEENQMTAHNLAIVFGPTLFQIVGTDKRAGVVVEDLVKHYQDIFDVDAKHIKSEIDMISQIMKAKEDHPEERPLTPRTICGVYLEVREEGAEVLVQMSKTMTAMEVVSEALERRNISPQPKDYWSCFLVSEKEDMERPLHYLEQVLPVYSSLDKDCHLVIKKNDYMKDILTCADVANVSRNYFVHFCEEKGQRTKGSFSTRNCLVNATSLEIYKPKGTSPEKKCLLQSLKVYCGIRKKLQPPTNWGMTLVCMEDQQEIHRWYLCCESNQELTTWLATFIFLQHNGDVWPGTS